MASLKKLFAPVDMTAGKPWKNIALFTIPMIIGNIAQQLYNTVDSIVVGKFVGDNALAAVGSASPIFNLLLVLFIGISVGTSVMVSQYFGARDREQLSRIHRLLCDSDGGRFGIHYDRGLPCGPAAAGAFTYAGQHHRLVRVLSDRPVLRDRRRGLL